MKYSEIVSYPRDRNRAQFPFVAHILVDAERFSKVERLIQDQTQARVLGHDLEDDDQIVIHVGCTSAKLQQVLERRWA